MEKIKEALEGIRNYIKNGLNNESPADVLETANNTLKQIDDIEKMYQAKDTELKSCKDFIIESVRSGGSKQPPQDPQNPRSMIEIARGIKDSK